MTAVPFNVEPDRAPRHGCLPSVFKLAQSIMILVALHALHSAPAAAADVARAVPRADDCLDISRLNSVSEAERSVLRMEWKAGLAREEETRLLNEMFERIDRMKGTTAEIHQLMEAMPAAGGSSKAAAPAVSPPASAQHTPNGGTPAGDTTSLSADYRLWAGLAAGSVLALNIAAIGWSRRRKQMVAPAAGTTQAAVTESIPAATDATRDTDKTPAFRMPRVQESAPAPARLPGEIAPMAKPVPVATPSAPATATIAYRSTRAPEPLPTVATVPSAANVSPSIDVSAPPQAGPSYDQTLELAEIMLSMGLASGAAQALLERIKADPRSALAHWLKLLEVYRDDGHRADFERVAAELKQNFNVRADDWMRISSTETPRLEKFDRVMTHIQEIWRQPALCIDYLERMLEDNREGMRAGFPQPVVEEMLLLINMAKDILASQPVPANADQRALSSAEA